VAEPDQGRPQGDPQGAVRPEQQGQQQAGGQPQEQHRGQVGQHRDAGDHRAAEGSGDQILRLHQEVGETARQQQQQHRQHRQQGSAAQGHQRCGGQQLATGFLAQTPTPLQLLQLQGNPQPHHHAEGQQLEQPAPP